MNKMLIKYLMKKFVILFLILLFFCKTQNVFATNSLFTVDNIEVNGTSKTSNNREKYLNLTIPMKERSRSINLANSVSIVMFEAIRQANVK